jgi:nicotinamide-nucleotide amidase
MVDPAFQLAQTVQRRLQQTGHRLVLAESCTAGLVASMLGTLPGISNHWCGSLVVYRPESKAEWLSVDRELWMAGGPGIVSEAVALGMARGALAVTHEATLAASITGHLGPDAPPAEDGLIWIGTAVRMLTAVDANAASVTTSALSVRLPVGEGTTAIEQRCSRQKAAACCMLERVLAAIGQHPGEHG